MVGGAAFTCEGGNIAQDSFRGTTRTKGARQKRWLVVVVVGATAGDGAWKPLGNLYTGQRQGRVKGPGELLFPITCLFALLIREDGARGERLGELSVPSSSPDSTLSGSQRSHSLPKLSAQSGGGGRDGAARVGGGLRTQAQLME